MKKLILFYLSIVIITLLTTNNLFAQVKDNEKKEDKTEEKITDDAKVKEENVKTDGESEAKETESESGKTSETPTKEDRKAKRKAKREKKKEEIIISEEELNKINPDLYDPRRAALLSAIIPGAGQIYNGSYWKLPFVYAGLITFYSLARIEDERYKFWLTPFVANSDNNPNTLAGTTLPSANNITNLKDQHRRDRDYYYILMGVWYALNVLEAAVDAHLKGFNVKDDVDVSYQPIMHGRQHNYASGLQFTISF